MGNFITFINSLGELKTICSLINLKLSKIREFHGSFKSICDTFAINFTEFEIIFSENYTIFTIWDTDGTGKPIQLIIMFRIGRCTGIVFRINYFIRCKGRRQN